MQSHSQSRRGFLERTMLVSGAVLAVRSSGSAADTPRLDLATNAYSWHVFYQREGRNFGGELEAGLKDVVASGIDGFEPGVGGAGEIRALLPLLKKHGLAMRSLYVNSTLHESAQAEHSMAQILAVAREVRSAGTRIIVTNPNPIQWGGAENKNDTQLRTQAAAMNRLGKALGELNMTLAYHNHDIELREGAREFHHMMAGTDPRCVTLCLDAHWIYRGCGNSQVALFDILKLYGARVSELHLRQSLDGVWSETFGDGDIDYAALSKTLVNAGARKPHLVLEVAVESGTPKTLSPVEAHRRSAEYARRVLAPLG